MRASQRWATTAKITRAEVLSHATAWTSRGLKARLFAKSGPTGWGMPHDRRERHNPLGRFAILWTARFVAGFSFKRLRPVI
jgi:hypothetical protein